MNKNTKIILLSIISVLIIITIVLGITYSFMRPINETSSITSVNLESCANITLTDTGESINLSNSYPMTKNRAFETTPYTFTVSSTCPDSSGFNLYLATLNTNTLPDSSIHYIITEHGNKNVISEGILSEATNGLSDFEDYEIDQLNNGINGTYGSIYTLYNGPLSDTEISYDLYLYIDESVTNETMGQTFSAGIAVKAGEYTPPSLAELCNGLTLSECITTQVYKTGENGLYYHDTDLANGAEDNSYRYAGANPNNYVCFGSTTTPCPAENLYRIIGVLNDNGEYQVKLIKSDYTTSAMLGTDGRDYRGAYGYSISNYKGSMDTSTIAAYSWNYDTSVSEWGSNNWTTSEFNTINLNTNYWNYLGATWQNLISPTTWHLGGMTSHSNTAKEFYDGERNNSGYGSNPTTYTDEIGLMYPSDYGYAAYPDAWTINLYDYPSSSITSNNWMYMGLEEWTITPDSSTGDFVFYVNRGFLDNNDAVNGCSARPVFYLKSNVEYNGGTGTESDPFTLVV